MSRIVTLSGAGQTDTDRRSLGARHRLPNGKRSVAEKSVVGGGYEMATISERATNTRMQTKEALCVTRRFESLHLTLLPSGMLIRVFRLDCSRTVQCRESHSGVLYESPVHRCSVAEIGSLPNDSFAKCWPVRALSRDEQ